MNAQFGDAGGLAQPSKGPMNVNDVPLGTVTWKHELGPIDIASGKNLLRRRG